MTCRVRAPIIGPEVEGMARWALRGRAAAPAARRYVTMSEADEIYCLNCGWPSSRDRYQCGHCWWSLKESESHQITGIAFLLNEARRFPMRELVPEPWLSRLTTRYRAVLGELAGWKAKPAAAAPAKREGRRGRKQRADHAA